MGTSTLSPVSSLRTLRSFAPLRREFLTPLRVLDAKTQRTARPAKKTTKAPALPRACRKGTSVMKRYVSITVVVLFVLLCVVCRFEGAPRVQAQSAFIQPAAQPATQPAGQPVTTAPATGVSDATTKDAPKEAAGSLDCAGCHGQTGRLGAARGAHAPRRVLVQHRTEPPAAGRALAGGRAAGVAVVAHADRAAARAGRRRRPRGNGHSNADHSTSSTDPLERALLTESIS